jgi:heparinase II/III-like protein
MWKDRYRRLLSMGPDELRERLRQQWIARTDLWRYRFGLDFAPKKHSSEDSRPAHFFFSGEDIPVLCSLLRERFPELPGKIIRSAERICQHRFDLLGYEDLDYGAEIDWHCDRVHGRQAARQPWFKVPYLDFGAVGDSKVTWELNRHQHLVTLAKAYRLSGEEKFAVELFRQWDHWHKENPYPIGVNWASSLEVAFRSLSWIWVYFLLSGSPAVRQQFRSRWLSALEVSGRHVENNLSTYFSPNTHLLGEALALFFIGVCCPELRLAERWRRRGWNIILQEAERQVRADGLHFEQSTYYHVYALDFFLHSMVLASLNEIPVPAELERSVERMLEALSILGRSGPVPRLGDDDGGRVFDASRNRAEHLIDPLATGAVLFGRGDFKSVSGGLREETLWLLGKQGVEEFDRLPEARPAQPSIALLNSGLYVMSDDEGERQLIIDAGPQGVQTAGHGHADALSIVASFRGHPLLIDSGTFEYIGKDSERNLFRGTQAHNTLVVDRLSQAQPKGPFAWAQLPRVAAEGWINGRCFDVFVGSHDGYTRLSNPVVHRRWVFSLKSRFWMVRDLALGSGKHKLDIPWHLNPAFLPQVNSPDTYVDPEEKNGLQVITAAELGWSRELRKDKWSLAYGRQDPCPVLHFSTATELPAEYLTVLAPVTGGCSGSGRLEKFPNSSIGKPVSGFRYITDEGEHSVFFGQDQSWTIDDWHSDAEFLYWGASRDGSGYTLICCRFTFLQRRGRSIIASPSSVLRCEIINRMGRSDVICPNQDAVASCDGLEAGSPSAS